MRAAYAAALPGARAAVLSRLWGALTREPINGVTTVARQGGELVVGLADGRLLRGPATAARPFAAVPDGLALTLDGAPFDHPATLVAALGLPGHAARLRAEVDDSVANLALARAAQPPPDGGPPVLDRLSRRDPAAAVAYAEQLVVDGHPLHPCCRTRIGLSTAEILAYAPEHRPIVDLAAVEVPADRWLATGTGAPPRLLVHPWQRDHVLDRYPWLRVTGATVPARPLMSLRTLAPVAQPDRHVKTAVDVQMTSAVRTVSAAAVHNGPALSALLVDVARDLPGFEVLAEVAAGAVVDDGAPVRSLAMVLRRAPRVPAGDVVVPLAALAARSPADGRALVCEAVTAGYGGRPAGFLTDLIHLLFAPLTTLLHRGVALEAHGQNMCVALRRGRPVRLFYRDFGGVRVSPRRLAACGYAAPPLHGDLESDDPAVLRTKLAAALLSTVVAQLVAVLAGEYGLEPATMWRIADRALADAYAALPPSAGGDARALRSGPWPVKATAAMRLADDPLDDLWTWHDNPLEAR
ncbi:IucA/IucC family siderophore biosynthesis protein [Planosporangium thailandense]|uniref:IucA/IucC family siderophore biosynthesis protein n=1 Tax=Planosporangium thailandense TaxID=765197 RepID=A0ABX0Y1Y3_9ACTN|nr:IucA/IucC family siderophore biosynthesis protein [Planosporangium thailandense]